MAAKNKELVPIRPVEIERIEITIVGDSSLITHATGTSRRIPTIIQDAEYVDTKLFRINSRQC